MKMKNKCKNIIRFLTIIVAACVAVSCSTTSRLAEDETLYTGVKKYEVTPVKGEKVPSEVDTYLFDVINVKPNNSLYSPYLRSPLPIGLWVYNHWNPDSKGLKGWLYNKLVEQPVVMDEVNPSLRVGMLKSILDNNGYFGGNATYEVLVNKKNSKKAEVSYFVELGKPYNYVSIAYTGGTTPLERAIDSLARRCEHLQVGHRYITDSLSYEREQISAQLRNLGYYYFQPDFIEYLADTVNTPGSVALRIVLADNINPAALKKYHINNVVTTVNRSFGKGTPDTLHTNRGMVIKMMPIKLRDNLIPSCLRFRKGRIVRVRDIDQTQLNLSRMGIFSAVNIDVTPLDSLNGRDSVDVKVNCTLDQPLEASFEIQATSKSNSYIGPGLVGSLTHKNVFGGGEQLTTQLTAGYEWQTGKGSSDDGSKLNSYEFGINSTLSFPRLLAPNFIDRSRRYINWTRVSLSGDLLNRPSFFKMVQFGTAFSWEWHANKNSLNEFTPFKLTYTKMLSTTEAFDAAMAENPAVALSFRDQFIPLMSYSYTYDKVIDRNNTMVWTFNVMEAGNVFSGIWGLAGKKNGEKKMFGTPFSQFVKAQSQIVYSCKLFHGVHANQWMVFRVFAGAAHAYGNSTQVPYSEQFYIGGANSLRAFGVRAVGPGSYRPGDKVKNGFYDQTGTFKFEFNAEYRFPLMGYLHGALFLDTGNIWLLEKDPSRPGGALSEGNFFKNLAVGTGLGLRFDMEMLVIRGDLGIGIHAPYETGKKGYYNMTSFKNSLAFHIAIGYPF